MTQKLRTWIAMMFVVALLVAGVPATQAALITGPWTSAQGDGPISNANTASPTVGDGSADSAAGETFHSAFPAITLANSGDKIVFDGKVRLTGTVNSPANGGSPRTQFRFGLFQDDGGADTEGWVGYLLSNIHGDPGGPSATLTRKNVGNTGLYISTTGNDGQRTHLNSAQGDGTAASLFHDDLYTMKMTVERSGNDLLVSASLNGANGYTHSLSHTDTDAFTRSTYTYDRVGFLLGNNLATDQAQFHGLSISIPEPASWVLALAGLIGGLRMRRRADHRP